MIGKQLHISEEKTLAETVEPVKNSEECAVFIKKPGRGTALWTSSWDAKRQTSAWVRWCQRNSYGSPKKAQWHILTPKPDARLYTVDSHGDLIAMLTRFEWDAPFIQEMNTRSARWWDVFLAQDGSTPTKLKRFAAIDFERMSQEYDGVHLTEKGNAETHLSYPHDLNAWDCESTLWFRWCFETVERIEPVTGKRFFSEDHAILKTRHD